MGSTSVDTSNFTMPVDPNEPPALTAPKGEKTNYVNPPTLMPAVFVTAALVYFVATASVLARLFVKAYIVRKHNIEDYLSYFAWAGLMTYTSIMVYVENYGLARHMWDIPGSKVSHMLYYVNILYCLYSPTTAAAKLSALFQIRRIFAVSRQNRVWWVVAVSIAANAIVYVALFLCYVFQCWPREKIWDTTGLVQGKCIDGNSSNLAAGILNLISDVEALLLPLWAIWHLQVPIKRKLSMYAVFGVGSVACGIGIGGIYVRVLVLRSPDFSWLGTKLAILVISEIAVVIMVGCMPILPRLYMFLRGRNRIEVKAKSKEGLRTIGGSGPQSGDKPSRKGNSLSSSLAKYLGPGASAGMTTLASRGSIEEDQFELKSYAAASGIRKTVDIDQESSTREHKTQSHPATSFVPANTKHHDGHSHATTCKPQTQDSTIFRSFASPGTADERYWWNTTGRNVANMMKAARYPEATQHVFLSYYRDLVCPLLGAPPNVDNPNQAKSWTWDGSTHEYSFELKKGELDQPEVRFVLDVSPLRPIYTKNPLTTRYTDALVETFAQRTPGFDSAWYNALKRFFDYSHLAPHDQLRLAKEAGHLSPILIGYDISRELASPTALPVTGKAYFLPCFAAAAQGITRFEAIRDSICSLPGIERQPNVLSGLRLIEEYLATKPRDWANGARFLGTDFLSPDRARLKIYLRCPSSEFDDIWDYFTLSGRIPGLGDDKETYRDFVKALGGVASRKVGHGGSDNNGMETGSRRKLTTLYFSLDSRYPVPSPKVAFCARNFAASDASVAQGLGTWLEKHNWGDGTTIGTQVADSINHRPLCEKAGIFTFIGLARKDPKKPDLSIQTYLCPELYETPRILNR
ncbi:aromatic prenyltransferase [Paramyrothecium foliicola]|nr:aromatic prenyltransferase [Paramyrothecium foliicola]